MGIFHKNMCVFVINTGFFAGFLNVSKSAAVNQKASHFRARPYCPRMVVKNEKEPAPERGFKLRDRNSETPERAF